MAKETTNLKALPDNDSAAIEAAECIGKADQRSDHGVAIAGEETWTAGIDEAVVARTHRRGLRVVAGLRARSEDKLLPSVEFHLNASPGFFVSQVPLA